MILIPFQKLFDSIKSYKIYEINILISYTKLCKNMRLTSNSINIL